MKLEAGDGIGSRSVADCPILSKERSPCARTLR